MEWLGRTIWPHSNKGCNEASRGLPPGLFNNAKLQHNKMDHLYELRDLIQNNSHHIRAVVVDRRPAGSSSPAASQSTSPTPAHGPRLYSMLRVLKEASGQCAEAWLRCLREAVQVHQRMADHPHIARLHHVYEDDEELCVMSDHLRGTRLYDEVLRRGRFKEAEVIPLVQQLLYIATCLQSHGVGLVIRPDVVFMENTSADGDAASPRYSLSLPDLFLIIAQNMAKERNVDTNGFSDMSAPLCYTAPEVLQMERCGATYSTLAAGNAPSDAPAWQGEYAGSSSATTGSPGARLMWDTSKSDVWQIGTIAFMLLSGGVPSHPYFAAAGSSAAEYALRRDDVVTVASPRAEAMTVGDPMMSPGSACTSPRLDFTGDCWLDVSESAKCFLVSLLANDPAKRPTARQALRHPWLCGGAMMMLEDICIDTIVDHVDVLPDYAERLPKFLVKKITTNTINYREIEAVAVARDTSPTALDSSAGAGDLGLGDLVAELILNILSFLPHNDLLRVGQASRHLYELASDNFLWKRLCLAIITQDQGHADHHRDRDRDSHDGDGDGDDRTAAPQHFTEDQVKQITYESIETQSASSPLSSPPPLFLSAFKRRRKNTSGGGGGGKKKGHGKGRNSDYASALLASMDKYVWKYFFFFGLPCRWNFSWKHKTIEPVNGRINTAEKVAPELWCTVLGGQLMRKGTHTWTVEITHADTSPGDVMVGVCLAGMDVSTSPSWSSDNAWLYHINQRSIFHKGTSTLARVQHVLCGYEVRLITCTFNVDEGTLSISLNDHDQRVVAHVPTVLEDGRSVASVGFYAAVDLYKAGDVVTLRSFSSTPTTSATISPRTAASQAAAAGSSTSGKPGKDSLSPEVTQTKAEKRRLDMSVSGSLIGDNGLQTVRVTKKFWNSRKTVNFACSLTQTLFHPGSQIDLAVSIDNRSSKTIRCLIITFRGVKGKKAVSLGYYSHTSFSSTEGTISFPIEGRRREEGTFTFRLPSRLSSSSSSSSSSFSPSSSSSSSSPSPSSSSSSSTSLQPLVDSYELHLELPIRGHSSLKAVLPLLHIQGYRTSPASPATTSNEAS